jgi:hypothetical protein
MIELIQTAQKFPGDIINDVKSGKIHIVCICQNGLTHLNVYAELYYKIPKAIVNECVDLVNSKKETGTLFPQAYISILPKSEGQQILNFEELESCVYDVFKANQEYLKSEIIYFTLESSYINKRDTLEIIKKKIAVEANADLYVKTIWFEE